MKFFCWHVKIFSKETHITFCWIPSHIDNKGNEKADCAAKDALSEAQLECFQLLYTNIFLAATKQLYEWYFLSVCPSVRLSVRLSHLFDYVPIIVSSWNFQELSHWTRVRSMQKVKVRGQRSRSQRSRPNFSFPDCNSSLNSHMMMKWYI